MEGTAFAVVSIPHIGIPVPYYGIAQPKLIMIVEKEDCRAEIYFLPFDRLRLRVIRRDGSVAWQGITSRLIRVGNATHHLLMIVWSEQQCVLALNGTEIWNSANSHPETSVMRSEEQPPAVDLSRFSALSAAAREARASSSKDLIAQGKLDPERLNRAFQHRIRLLEEDLTSLTAGDDHRLISLGANLRALLASGRGNKLLQRIGGIVDADLTVFCLPAIEVLPPRVPDFMLSSSISFTETATDRFPVDLDVWLEMKAWWSGGRFFSNSDAIKAFGDTEGSHTDENEHPLVTNMRKLHDSSNRAILISWFHDLGETTLSLARRRIYSHKSN